MKKYVFTMCALLSLVQMPTVCYGGDSIYQDARLELGYATGKYINIDEDYAEVGTFLPIALSDWYTPFIDLTAYRFTKSGHWAGSFGLGVRQELMCHSVIGVNAYYDFRRAHDKKNYNQVGLGFELLNGCWDFRVNGYLPYGDKTRTVKTCNFNQIGGGYLASQRELEFAYKGIDAELGFYAISQPDFSVYAAAGPYYYHRSNQNHFWGGYARIELDILSFVSLQVRASYDDINETKVQGLFQLSVPFDLFLIKSCCWSNCFDRVHRNGLILIDRCCDWNWNWNDQN